MTTHQPSETTDQPLYVCSYEDRPEAMDSLILMGESLCRVEPNVSLHLTVPEAPDAVRAWADSRPQVVIHTTRPEGVTGWDVKPWLLLRELNAGRREALWLDTDMIVTRPISRLIRAFPRDSLIVSEEWTRTKVPVSRFWGLRSVRPMWLINACVVRATETHRPLLERWLQLNRDAGYRHAQTLPFASRPSHLIHDGWLLVALLESEDFSQVPFDCLRAGRDIAQCAGSSSYLPRHRALALFRGLPPLIHGLGRKPWDPTDVQGIRRYLLDLATDVSPYVLAARRAARDLDIKPEWLQSRTFPGAALGKLTANHPAMAGLPMAILHSIQVKLNRAREPGQRAIDKQS